MLILVAVTVTVAKDGGLFETARTAKTGTQKEADRENLVAAAVGAYDARSQEVKEEELKQNLGNEWRVENQTNYYKVTSPNGNEFKVNIKNATVEDNKEEAESDFIGEYKDCNDNEMKLQISKENLVWDGEIYNYTYNENKKTITVTFNDSGNQVDYEIFIFSIKDDAGKVVNKVILPAENSLTQSDVLGVLYTTNGTTGFNMYKKDTDERYINNETGYYINFGTSTDEAGNEYGTIDMGDKGIYIKIDQYIYTSWGTYEQTSDSQVLDLSDNLEYTKVSD